MTIDLNLTCKMLIHVPYWRQFVTSRFVGKHRKKQVWKASTPTAPTPLQLQNVSAPFQLHFFPILFCYLTMEKEEIVDLPPNPDAPPSKGILALGPDVVHKICADRVIGSMAIAVKELVENSIDAGATKITVRVKNYGLESVEVADNGKGVQESDFEALTRSYCTSKLSNFSDLDSIGTFGFRGEALSSLCRLCEGLVVVTRHASATCASKLEYDAMGNIIKNTPCAGEVGTKITLNKLFSPLPVRRKVFASKCQQEFNKAMHILHAYCIIAEGVKIQIHHQRGEGKDWSMLVGTHGGKLKDNLGSVVGYKSLANVLPFPDSASHHNFQLQGYISSCAHDAGRRTLDKQYFYINGRPCDLPKVSRLVNQLYRQFNKHQAPLVVLNVLSVTKNLVDVNLAPDKRSIVLKSEATLLELVKTTLLAMYENIPRTMILHTESVLTFNQSPLSNNQNTSEVQPTSTFANLSKFALGSDNRESRFKESPVVECSVLETSQVAALASPWTQSLQPSTSSPLRHNLDRFKSPHSTSSQQQVMKRSGEILKQETKYLKLDNFVLRSPKTGFVKPMQEMSDPKHEEIEIVPVPKVTETSHIDMIEDEIQSESLNPEPSVLPEKVCVASTYTTKRREVTVPISLEKIKQMTKRPKKDITQVLSNKFTASLSAGDAEEELSREIHKTMFLKMNVIGQFNKGFVIAELDSDIFIIDQHAADEKYNFERLSKNTALKNQPLVIPRQLDLNPVHESIFIENQNVFRRNGFDFIINEADEPSKKIKLTAVPTYLHSTFGTDDILDLLSQVQEAPHENCQPTRIRGILASKACRQSIMIGRPLDHAAMKKLVDNLATMDHPWSCPHGRPTMRHLVNMKIAKKNCSNSEEAAA